MFIRDHPIAKQVERYEPGRLRLARYVEPDGEWEDGQLAVIRLFLGDLGPTAPMNERGKLWVICVRCLDEDDKPMTGEPNGYILYLLQRFDAWAHGRDPKHLEKWANRVRDGRKKRESERYREQIADDVGRFVRQYRRERGVNPSIFVPDKT